MKNRELAEKAYEDYKVYLRKEAEIQNALQALRDVAKTAEDAEKKLEIYEEMDEYRHKLEIVRRSINTQARTIVRYVFE